jgi:hypothetical protein
MLFVILSEKWEDLILLILTVLITSQNESVELIAETGYGKNVVDVRPIEG